MGLFIETPNKMDNSEQTPYNRHGLKLYCKKDQGSPIQYPKPKSKKNIIKSSFSSTGSAGSRKNGKNKHNTRTKKQQFWKYDHRHIDQDDFSEFHLECEFVYESTWHPTTCWIDDWVNYHPTPNLDAGWLDCKCDRCKGCMCPNQLHICLKLIICYCREPAYRPWSDDEQDDFCSECSEDQKYNSNFYREDNKAVILSSDGKSFDFNHKYKDDSYYHYFGGMECGMPFCQECYPYSDDE